MRHLELTLPDAAANVALDEALLDEAERSPVVSGILRMWEPARPMVVVGRSSRAAEEVHLDACRRRGVPVLRRTSGGAAIVAGPGCLMYALVLPHAECAEVRHVDTAHRYVLKRMAAALRPLVPEVARRGTSDLAQGVDKFSGNSLRCRRQHVLYHGTLLYDFKLELVEELLRRPPREPEYRQGRSHRAFLRNLDVDVAALRAALVAAWEAREPMQTWPEERTRALVAAKYLRDDWNLQGVALRA